MEVMDEMELLFPPEPRVASEERALGVIGLVEMDIGIKRRRARQ